MPTSQPGFSSKKPSMAKGLSFRLLGIHASGLLIKAGDGLGLGFRVSRHNDLLTGLDKMQPIGVHY